MLFSSTASTYNFFCLLHSPELCSKQLRGEMAKAENAFDSKKLVNCDFWKN